MSASAFRRYLAGFIVVLLALTSVVRAQVAGEGAVPGAEADLPVIVERATAENVVEVREPSRGERIAKRLQEKGFSTEAAIFSISLLPIVELRGAIPAGHILLPRQPDEKRFGASDWLRSAKIYFWAVLGNMAPTPFILLLLGPLSRLAMKTRLGNRFFTWLFARTRRKTASIEKYEFWGLAVFVAIPLPVTGAWTGAMAGWLLGIPFWSALLSLFIGVCFAGIIMTALSLLGWTGLAIALAALFLLVLVPLLRKSPKPASQVP